MNHHIIVKWNEEGKKLENVLEKVTELFQGATSLDGITSVSILPNIVDRSNRYDLMIRIKTTTEGLQVWDASAIHKEWKAQYSPYIESKTIIDTED